MTALDDDWVTLNQMIKYYKYGFGRATDYVNEEIRLGRMTREEGIHLVHEYDGCCSVNTFQAFAIILIFLWMIFGASPPSLNHELFDLSADGMITPKFEVGVGL